MGTRKYNKAQVKEMCAALEQYIAATDDPFAADFLSGNEVALRYWLDDMDLYAYPAFERLRARMVKKSEATLLKETRNSKGNTIMTIFRLKQPWHGYRDKFEQDITSNGQPVTFLNTVPRPTPKKPGTSRGKNKELAK